MHDVTFRVPLVVRRPGTVPAMRVRDEIVSHVDLLPTLLDHAGVDGMLPPTSPGRSFAAAVRGGPLDGWLNQAFFENETARAIRTHEYLFVAHLEGTGEAELYDLIEDPGQRRNVAADTNYRQAVLALDAQLRQFFDDHADPRYDLWHGGTGQAMVSRYLLFKQRYGDEWDVTCEVGRPFEA